MHRWRREEGGVLVEFSISILVLWLILAATLDLGRAFAAAQVLQGAARAAARELALQEEPWNASFDNALTAIFDPDYLVIDAECLEERASASERAPGDELNEILRSRGLVLNRMLRPLMIFENVAVGGQERRLLRYPGALLASDVAPVATKPCVTPFTVGIPELDDAGSRVVFHAVVEELESGAFSLGAPAAGAVPPGTVALRLHYPFQAVGLSAWRVVGNSNQAVLAEEADGYSVEGESALGASTIDELDARRSDGELQAYALRETGDAIPIYGGRFGLGFHALLGENVRPFRRVITAQAMAPREVIGAGS